MSRYFRSSTHDPIRLDTPGSGASIELGAGGTVGVESTTIAGGGMITLAGVGVAEGGIQAVKTIDESVKPTATHPNRIGTPTVLLFIAYYDSRNLTTMPPARTQQLRVGSHFAARIQQ